MLRKTPVFTGVAILSLAIGIGANTAVFSLVDTVLLKMLPVKNPEQLVVLRWGAQKDLDLTLSYASNDGDAHGGWTTNVVSWRIFSEMRDRSRTLDAVMGFSWLPEINVVARGQALVTGGMLVSGNYFSTLGAETLLGRPILEDDDTADGAPAAVISYRFWEQFLGLDPGALGATIYVNGQACTVVGVTRSGFVGVSPGGFHGAPRVFDITLPIRAKERLEGAGASRTAWFAGDLQWVQVMGRLSPQRATEECARCGTGNHRLVPGGKACRQALRQHEAGVLLKRAEVAIPRQERHSVVQTGLRNRRAGKLWPVTARQEESAQFAGPPPEAGGQRQQRNRHQRGFDLERQERIAEQLR